MSRTFKSEAEDERKHALIGFRLLLTFFVVGLTKMKPDVRYLKFLPVSSALFMARKLMRDTKQKIPCLKLEFLSLACNVKVVLYAFELDRLEESPTKVT